MNLPSEDVFLINYAPEKWSQLERLLHFLGPPLAHNGNVRIGLQDCEAHLQKVDVLWRIAERLRPNLVLDREELERIGGTSNQHSEEFAAMCEGIVCSLYSAIDGLRTFFFGAHKHVQGIQDSSNGKLFDKAVEGKYGAGFPEDLRLLLAEARDAWFTDLRKFRTELTHGTTGSCHLDAQTGQILYFNNGLGTRDSSYVVEDIEGKLRGYHQRILELVESIAHYHLAVIEPHPTFQICGMYRARMYARTVLASAGASWADGQCLSHDWFEKEEGFLCPLAAQCPAYQNKYPGGYDAFTKA
ncbi:MAG: hypothetical protein JNM99_14790 [Verrucomicrobiaceae bacterium]|nr:hypothetical protein [Verrucomicrobiaceae bacterium]